MIGIRPQHDGFLLNYDVQQDENYCIFTKSMGFKTCEFFRVIVWKFCEGN